MRARAAGSGAQSGDPALDDGIKGEIDAFLGSLATEDGREGVAAFLEKREPRFEGK